MGSGAFAAHHLTTLIADGMTPVAVYTQPQRRAGRGRRKVAPNPVRTVAEAHAIPIHDPATSLRDARVLTRLRTYAPDIIIVVAYGKILPRVVLDLPRYGCLNIHASLLPRWRGATPIHAAIAAGDTQTGVTLMRMDEGLDTGPIIAQSAPRTITPDMRTPALFDALAYDGAALLRDVLPRYIAGDITPTPQPHDGVTTCRTLTRDDGALDFSHSAAEIYNRFRAYDPWPGIFAYAGTMRIRFTDISIARQPPATARTAAPGTLLCHSGTLYVATGSGTLHIHTLQRSGKKSCDARTFINGNRTLCGAQLTPQPVCYNDKKRLCLQK